MKQNNVADKNLIKFAKNLNNNPQSTGNSLGEY
jgi:hypothetical protein